MDHEFDIAIVGMACRFPGASSIAAFWNNLVGGVESIARLSDQEILAAGVSPALLARSDYVKAAPVLDAPDAFDATFFGYAPGEAGTMDPQQRILLELAYAAIEDAGCDPERFPGRVGVFTGSAMNTYFMNSGLSSRFAEDYIPTLIVNDKDFLGTRISYKLGLRGPSMTVQTACSTSLVAIHLARQSLLNEETDLALAGTVSVRVPHRAGYIYDGGGVVSSDGHVRAFDAGANGTVFGSGAGVIVMKRLTDALAQGDHIHAVIKGSAVNNDGSGKAGYTTPSVNGQADVVVEAIANAGVEADTISYLEAHGSGTPVGDPIEVLALTKAFRNFTQRNRFCALGSVKTNVGHLDAAAGMAGMIKTILALKHRVIPPTLHYSQANPEIDFDATPFFVNKDAMPWTQQGHPLRAGIMSTGMGGTNAYVVLEEAPAVTSATRSTGPSLLLLSAKSPSALEAMSRNLAEFLASPDAPRLSDVAHTLQTGRKFFPYRRFVVANSAADAVTALSVPDTKKTATGSAPDKNSPAVVFLMPGVGDHYVGMGEGLYARFDVFRQEVDRCAQILQPLIGLDVRELLFPKDRIAKETKPGSGIDLKRMLGRTADEPADPAAQKLDHTIHCQPALFTVEYALARLWLHWGIKPDRIIGHSMGEYVAACLAGVFSLEDGLKLIAARAKLVHNLPQGMMLAVMVPEKELLPLLGTELSISLINGPKLCVVAGPVPAMTAFQSLLKEKEIIFRPVRNAHAFHSRMLDPIVEPLAREVRKVRLNAPRIPFISNVTGTWITPAQAVDPLYWVEHARRTARFSDALEQMWKLPNVLPLEAGPGRTLGVLAMQHPARPAAAVPVIVSSLRHNYESQPDTDFILNSLGRLWLAGAKIDWEKLDQRSPLRKVSLPTYPFEQQRYWIQPQISSTTTPVAEKAHGPKADLTDWFYVPTWERTAFAPDSNSHEFNAGAHWIILGDPSGFSHRFKQILEARGATVVLANFGGAYARKTDGTFAIRPANLDDYLALFGTLKANLAGKILNMVHLGSLSSRVGPPEMGYDSLSQDLGFYSLLNVAKAVGELSIAETIRIGVVTRLIHEVTGEEKLNPAMATILGPCGVIPKEYPNITSFSVDLPIEPKADKALDDLVQRLTGEFFVPEKGAVIAYRGKYRWTRSFKSQPLPAPKASPEDLAAQGLRHRGVYLITGGTGGIGLVMAKHLAKTCQARLVLTKKSPFLEKSLWSSRLAAGNASDSERQLIEHLQEIESLGGEAEVVACDASDRAGMKRVVAQTLSRYQSIHGVIHAAGVIGVGLIQVKTKDFADRVLAPKVEGGFVLYEALEGVKPDFVMLVSSLASITMPFAHVDYCAAHAFMDASADYYRAKTGCRTLTINWPIWREVGILAEMKAQTGVEGWRDEALQKGIITSDGVEAFKRALSSNFSHLVVSPEELGRVLIDSRAPVDSPGLATGNGPTASKPMVKRHVQTVEEPQDDVERAVAEIWSAVLGIAPIGRRESFLDLGGHSLMAMQIVSRVRSAYGSNFTLRNFFEAPTVADVAANIQAGILAEIEKLDDADVKRLLSEQ